MGFIGNQEFCRVSYTNLGTVKGKVADSDALNAVTGMSNGDLYLQEDNGHSNIYDGNAWIDLGPIVGPTGPTGVAGPIGPAGIPGVIDHITKTNGDIGSGTTVTYTAYADVDETQSLGTFDVYNGTNGEGTISSLVAGTNITIDNTDAANPVINVGDTLPEQGDNTGKFLTTDGSAASWAEVVSSEHYDQEDTPTPSSTGATWYVPSTGVIYKYVNDGTNDVWIDISTAGAGVSQTYVDGADALKADKAQDIDTSTVYTDNTTAATYKMYMDNGEIIMEEL